MDNYFILLGLSFDPVETDEEKIKAAINEKRQQWQADAKNPRKQGKAKQMLASIPEIENVMLNPVLRKQEAGKAVVVKQKHIKDMKNEVLLLSIKGHITEDEVAALIDKYSKLSLSEKDIYSAITVPIGDSSETFELTELHSISEEEASQLETYFKNLNEDDMSIFTHYNIPEDAPPEYVISVANGVLTEILQKGSKELRDELEQKIAGIIINIFSDSPEKYFDYLRGFRFAGLNELIDTTIKSSKTLTLRPFTMLMDIARKEYPYADKLFIADYIVSHCSIKNHEITQDVLEEVYNIANSPQEEEHTIPYEVMEELERQNSVPQPEQQPPQPQPLQPQPQPLQPQPQPPQPEQQPLQPQPQPQPQPEPGSTADILNKVITPFNSLIVSYRNKTSQLSQLLTQYQTKRMEAGSGLSKGYVYFCFSLFAINIIVAIVLLLIHKNGMFNMVRLVLAAVNIGSGIFGAFTIYPPFVHWNQMESCVKAAKLAETEIAKIHDEFIHLNFSLLIEDNSKIIQQMESIQARAEKEFNTSKSNYAKYTTLSKKYVQKDYFTKILLTSIGAIVASILFIFLAH